MQVFWIAEVRRQFALLTGQLINNRINIKLVSELGTVTGWSCCHGDQSSSRAMS